MKIKILYLSPQNPFPPTDGGKISIYYSVKYIAEIFDVFLFFPVEPNVREEHLKDTKENFLNIGVKTFFFQHNTKNDLRYLFMNIKKEVPFKWDKYFSKNGLKLIEEIIVTQKIRYLWVNFPHMASYAVQLKQKYNDIKIYLREHNIEFSLVQQFIRYSKNPAYKLIATWQLKKTKKMEILLWSQFDKVFFISDLDYETAVDTVKKENVKIDINKFHVLYDGVELNNQGFKNHFNKNGISIIYPGNFETLQNIENFGWFIKEIWAKNLNIITKLDIRLTVTGKKIEVAKSIVSRFLGNKNTNIEFAGFVSDLKELISQHMFILSPTVFGSGVRIKVIEGMANGSVILLTPLDASTLKVLKDMYNVVVFGNAEEFINKVMFLSENNDLYSKISEQARATAMKHFNWKKFASMIYDIITDPEDRNENYENSSFR